MLHSHNHENPQYNSAFIIGALLNIGFVIVEFIFGIMSNSLALIADAGHNASDVVILLLAWGANWLATVKPTKSHTYGYRRATILAAFISGFSLIATMAIIAWESIARLATPISSDAGTIIIVASIGVVINFATAALFFKDQHHDLNVRGAFLHMMADAIVSVGVVITGIVIYYTGLMWVDPAISLLIVIAIGVSAWSLLRDSFNLAVDAVPDGVDIDAVSTYLLSQPNVDDIHDLHIWAMSTTQVALTAHLLRSTHEIDDSFVQTISKELKQRFNIHHATIQVENGRSGTECHSCT